MSKNNCQKCGKKHLQEYRMALMMGPKGYRRYSVCMDCAKKLKLPEPRGGGRQLAKAQHEVENASL